MVLESLFPVFALLALGSVLRRCQFTTAEFLKTSDRLIYFIFFPVLLFWKIGGAGRAADFEADYLLAALCTVMTAYLLSTLYIRIAVPAFQAGTFSQSCYRFNTYIGMAIVLGALGEEGVRYFGILIGFMIPVINVLAVSTLTWFSGEICPMGQRLRLTARAVATNPLIIACLSGMLYARWVGGFPVSVDNLFRLSAAITLPLALLSIGGSLTFSSVRGRIGLSAVAAMFKLVVMPLSGLGFLRLFQVEGTPYQVSLIFFALPASTAIYVLSAQLNSDTQLASASIVMSTLLSAISLSIVLAGF